MWLKLLLSLLYFIIDIVGRQLDDLDSVVDELTQRHINLEVEKKQLEDKLEVLNSQVIERLKVRDSLLEELSVTEYEIDRLVNYAANEDNAELTDEEAVRVNL